MSDFTYYRALQYGPKELATFDIRVMAVMTNTTCHTEKSAQFLNSFTTKDEFNGAGYSRQDPNGELVTIDTVNGFVKLAINPVVWSNISPGTRSIKGLVLYRHVSSDADSEPLFWRDSGGFPYTPPSGGGPLTINIPSGGLAQWKDES